MRAPQHALDRAIGVRHGIERVGALVLDRDRLAKVRMRDAARRAGELQREVLELDDLDPVHRGRACSTALSATSAPAPLARVRRFRRRPKHEPQRHHDDRRDQRRHGGRPEQLLRSPSAAAMSTAADRRPDDRADPADAETGADAGRPEIRRIVARRQRVEPGCPPTMHQPAMNTSTYSTGSERPGWPMSAMLTVGDGEREREHRREARRADEPCETERTDRAADLHQRAEQDRSAAGRNPSGSRRSSATNPTTSTARECS